ncbi:MAG: HlyD family secretion protein [Burkholderiales bacterium]|nr:HlyD family secretion protein [Burkholderiales bacterium]MDP3715711.1 HlyD family secretion protein [Burkholderiales bacterium]
MFARSKSWLLAAAALALLVWIVHWSYFRWTHVYIDDARIDGEIITLSSRVSGWVTELPVIEGEIVKKGDLLFHIDDRDSRLQRDALIARLQSIEGQMAGVRARSGQVDLETQGKYQSENHRLKAAEAEAASLEAQARQARDDYERARELAAAKWLSPQAMERSRTAYQAAQEKHRKAVADIASVRGTVAAAHGSRRELQVMQHQYTTLARQADEIRAEISRRDIDIADRVITSPDDGQVVRTFVRKGEHVSAGQRILMFHNPEAIWVEANVKETDIARLKPGMEAQIRVDAYPGRTFKGEVFRIGRAATSKFALLPDPNPSGNFTKITQRLPVRIRLAQKDPVLRPGMMVEVVIAARRNN